MELPDVTPTNSPTNTLSPSKSSGPQSSKLQPNVSDMTILCDNYKDLLKKLVCPGCDETFTLPVVICVSGHSICGKCSVWMNLCPTCFQPLTNTKNKNLQNILIMSSFDCPRRIYGCTVKMTMNAIVDHYQYCEFDLIMCPLGRLASTYCTWEGTKKDFLSHVKTHRYSILHDPEFTDTFPICPFTASCTFLFFGKEIFAYHNFIVRDRWIFLVEQVGMTPKKYNCVFKLKDAKDFSHIRVTFPISDTDELFLEKISSGKCFRMPVIVMRNFIIDNMRMDVVLSINDVTECTSL